MSDKNLVAPVNDISYYITILLEFILVHVKFILALIEGFVKLFLPKEPISVKGENVLITGAGHGIGKELALQYSALGAKVICWDINEQTNAQTVKEIEATGGKAVAYTCNVMKRSEIEELAEKVKKEHGFISILVNNAGIMPTHPLLQTTETEIRNMFEINVLAHFWIIQAFLPDMLERNTGHIVALSSCAGLFGLPNLVPYCSTKFAVRGIMQALGEELRSLNPQNNIKLTSIYPYMVDTGLCKKPRFRFPKLFKLISPQFTAASIIKAQRTSQQEVSVPRVYLYLHMIARMIPTKAMQIVFDFLDAGVDSDL